MKVIETEALKEKILSLYGPGYISDSGSCRHNEELFGICLSTLQQH